MMSMKARASRVWRSADCVGADLLAQAQPNESKATSGSAYSKDITALSIVDRCSVKRIVSSIRSTNSFRVSR